MKTPEGTSYAIHGPAGAPVVVLIHGLGLCSALWDDHIDALATKYQVVTYDLHGHGQSDPPHHTATLAVYAQQIVALLDNLAVSRAHIVGFSIGGMINRRLVLDAPDRVASLVILNSPHDRGEEAQRTVETRAQKVRTQGALSTMDAALTRWFTPSFLTDHANQVQRVIDWRLQVDGESYAQAAWVLANGVRELINPATPITVPTLVMTCENDSGSTPAMSHAIAADFKGAETVIVRKLQHLGLMEQPEVFTHPILDFLERAA